MKTLHAITTLLLISVNLFGQFNSAGGALYPASGMEGYKMVEETFNHQLINRMFITKETGKPALEFKRYDADNFIRIEYDSTGQQQRKGIISPNKAKAPHFKISMPDLVNDPDMSRGLVKDTVLYDDYYDKNGYWEEDAGEGKQLQGYYNHDVKTGIWKKTKPDSSGGAYVIDSILIYQNGILLSDNYKALSASQLFSLISGKWYFDPAESGNRYEAFRRKPLNAFGKYSLYFITPDKMETSVEADANSDHKEGLWTFEKNQLQFKFAGSTIKKSIVLLDGERLILRGL